jgi:hypothetical protein
MADYVPYDLPGAHVTDPYSVSALRANLYRLLDRVLETGRPLEVERRGERLKIVRSERQSRLSLVRPAEGYLNVDADELLGLDWSEEWRG